jgi:class 3 adenylate cyclase
MADRVEPEVISQVIGEYMAAMADIVDTHRGTVNEFVGDGLMALFGAPRALDPEEQARCAVRAAQAMQARLPELNARWRKLGLGGNLQVRIGINTGMVSVGSYGSEGRMTYTAIGLQTNIAARIQARCEPGDILLSDATWQLVQGEIPCESRGTMEIKGVHYPVATYSPATNPPGTRRPD